MFSLAGLKSEFTRPVSKSPSAFRLGSFTWEPVINGFLVWSSEFGATLLEVVSSSWWAMNGLKLPLFTLDLTNDPSSSSSVVSSAVLSWVVIFWVLTSADSSCDSCKRAVNELSLSKAVDFALSCALIFSSTDSSLSSLTWVLNCSAFVCWRACSASSTCSWELSWAFRESKTFKVAFKAASSALVAL